MSMQKQASKRVAIFGATSDIASAVARRYAESGAYLVLIGRDPEALAATAADLRVRGASDVCEKIADFTAINEFPKLVDDVWRTYDTLDIALIAYGSLPDQPTIQKSATDMRDALALNFSSPAVLASMLAEPFEAKKGGTIAVITSAAGDRGRKSNYVYGAAKGGLQRFLEGLRHRLHVADVAVLDIRPGFVSTKMTTQFPQKGPLWATSEKVAADIVKAIEQRRAVVYTPWFWAIILTIVRSLPRPLFHKTSL